MIAWFGDVYIASASIKSFINDWLLNIIGYSTPFALGLAMRNSNKEEKSFYLLSLFAVLCVVFLYYLFSKGFPIRLSPEYKYPPQSYYLIYGLFMSCLLWTIKQPLTKVLDKKALIFVGQNTIWIYLYHIPVLMFVGSISNNWMINYIIVLVVSISLAYIQFKFSVRFMNRLRICKYLVG